MSEFTLLLCFVVKHFVCDFPLQAFPWMYKNKGTYLHPGGVVHAGIHAIGTGIVLAIGAQFIHPSLAVFMILGDGCIHYHIDWAKMNIGAHYKLRPDNSEWFWQLLGLDQFLHYLTYFAIVYTVMP